MTLFCALCLVWLAVSVANDVACEPDERSWWSSSSSAINQGSLVEGSDIECAGNVLLRLHRTSERLFTIYKDGRRLADARLECKKSHDRLVRYFDFYTWRFECDEMQFSAKIIPSEARLVFASNRDAIVAHDIPQMKWSQGSGRWGPSRPLDGYKGSPPGMGAKGSSWDQFVWYGNETAGIKIRLMTHSIHEPESDEFEMDGPQLDWKVPPPYPSSYFIGRNISSRKWSYSVTPISKRSVKTLRRYHSRSWIEPDCCNLPGVKVVVLHHGTRLNPRINSPLHNQGELVEYVDKCRRCGVETAIYYTLREISTTSETYLRHRDEERYPRAWTQALQGGLLDTSVGVSGRGGWANVFIHTATYLRNCVGIAELYVDGFAGAPWIFRRLPGDLRIDLHPANKTANYIELAPYVDTVWTGESNDYAVSKDLFATKIAAAGFGWKSMMLSGQARKSASLYMKGVYFGMTDRPGWSGGVSTFQRASALWDLFDLFSERRETIDCLAAYRQERGVMVMRAFGEQCRVAKSAIAADPSWRIAAPFIPGLQRCTFYEDDDAIPLVDGIYVVASSSFVDAHPEFFKP